MASPDRERPPGGSKDGPPNQGTRASSWSAFERLTLALLLSASACIFYVAVWLVMAFLFRGALEAAASAHLNGAACADEGAGEG